MLCFLGPHFCWRRSPLGTHLTQNWVPILDKIGSPWHLGAVNINWRIKDSSCRSLIRVSICQFQTLVLKNVLWPIDQFPEQKSKTPLALPSIMGVNRMRWGVVTPSIPTPMPINPRTTFWLFFPTQCFSIFSLSRPLTKLKVLVQW